MNRILGPNHNRLVIIDGARDSSGRRLPGHVDTATADMLKGGGWTPYDGPAEAVGGWIVPGSDPRLTPRTLKR